MITLIDRYGFVKQLKVELPPGTPVYRMACYRSRGMSLFEDKDALYTTVASEVRDFVRQGNTNVFEER